MLKRKMWLIGDQQNCAILPCKSLLRKKASYKLKKLCAYHIPDRGIASRKNKFSNSSRNKNNPIRSRQISQNMFH